MSKTLLTEIRDFLKSSGMGPTYFGKVSCGNTELVDRLENGKTVTLVTADKVREYIAERSRQGEAA